MPASGAKLAVKGLVQEPNRAAHWAERHPLDCQTQQMVSREQLGSIHRHVAAVAMPVLGSGEGDGEGAWVDHRCGSHFTDG